MWFLEQSCFLGGRKFITCADIQRLDISMIVESESVVCVHLLLLLLLLLLLCIYTDGESD